MKTFIFAISAAVGLFSCGGPSDPDLTCDAAPAAATLATNVQAVFDAKCKSCHVVGTSYGDYTDATKTAAATVGKKSIYAGMSGTLQVVEAKSLANSALWLKVLGGQAKGHSGPKGENTYGAMPNDGTTLSAEQQKLLKDWICSGAK